MMDISYTLIPDLNDLIDSIQPESIISRTFYKARGVTGIVFGFDAGQTLSEHTSSQSAMIQILDGEATVTLGDDMHRLSAGAWAHMPPHLKHSIHADTPLIMLLIMTKGTGTE